MNIPLNIDWQQILLHLFNFSILVGGLYLLLFKPVKNFMDKRAKHYADMESAAVEREKSTAAYEQADKIVAAARENAENDRKKIVDEANREAVSIAEAAMEKLLAKETSRAYDAFVNAAEGEEKHEHE